MNRTGRRGFLASLRHAAHGLLHVVREERNARIHAVAGAVVLLLSAWLGLRPVEWALMIVAITLVFAGEMLNTVVERLVDLHSTAPHPLAGQAKDVAAGAVLFASVAAAVLGLLVLGPRLWVKLSGIL